MTKVKFLLFAMVALLATSCVNDFVDEVAAPSDDVVGSAKFVNSSTSVLPGELIIYVSDEAAEQFAAAKCATRSGNVEFDAIAAELGAESIEQVFNMAVDTEAKKAMGLHRWFIVKFDAEQNVEAVAKKFAAMDDIKRIQFSSKIVNPRLQAIPAMPGAVTRAANMPFNDDMLPAQWHYDNRGDLNLNGLIQPVAGADINLFEAWKYTTGNREVVVAVMDEGVFYDHPDLADNMWVNDAELTGAAGVDDDGNGFVDDVYGWNAVYNTGEITWNADPDDSGHATHVAGTVAAVNNNGGVAGVAGGSGPGTGTGARIMSCQIFSGAKTAGPAGVARAAQYAADNGACILQNSWGYEVEDFTSDAQFTNALGVEMEGYKYFLSKSGCSAMKGNVIIFAAGNDGETMVSYPGGYNEFLCVTAVGPDGLPTWYTNHGPGANVAAPGGELYTYTYNGGMDYWMDGCVLSSVPSDIIDVVTGRPYGTPYAYMQGTSMACPHVSGIAALVLSYAVENGISLTNKELYEILTTSVEGLDNKLTGKKINGGSLGHDMNLLSYKGKMGTGTIDAFRAIMNVRGATCVPIVVGQEYEIDLNDLVGDGNLNLTVLKDYTIPADVRERLGIVGDTIFGGKVILTCTKPGCGVITLNFVAGGTIVGGGQIMGGMRVEKEVALISRVNNNTAGWL